MLKAHIDIEVLVDAIKKFQQDEIIRLWDFIGFIRKDSDLTIYGNVGQQEGNLLSILLQGRGEAKVQKVNKKSCLLVRQAINNPYQVFIAGSNETSDELNRNFFFANMFDYEEKFEELNREGLFRVGGEVTDNKFTGWQDLLLKEYVSDIIIVDPFIVNADNISSLERNYYSLIRLLSSQYELRSLLIFTKYFNSTDRLPDFTLKTINETSRKILGKNVTFGLIPFTYDQKEHDRYIFMNYHYFWSGNSFSSIFRNDGEMMEKNSSTIRAFPLSQSLNYKHMDNILRRLLKSLDKLHQDKENLQYINSRLFHCIRNES
jgi:hypothetical protein